MAWEGPGVNEPRSAESSNSVFELEMFVRQKLFFFEGTCLSFLQSPAGVSTKLFTGKEKFSFR